MAGAALLPGCGSSPVKPVSVPTDGGPVHPGSYEDGFVKLERLAGSTFVEILEVRARDDDRLFFCTGVRGLQVVDISRPSKMSTLHQLASSLGSAQYPRCQHLAWDGDIVYVTNRGDEIQPQAFVAAFDIGQSPPREIATYRKPGRTFEGIAAAGGRVYLAMHKDGLAVLEREGGTISERGVATGLVNAWGVAAAGAHVYVADGAGGLAIIDASDPRAPRVVGRVETGGAAQSVFIDGAVAYVAAGAAGLVVVDVRDPAIPAVLASVDTPGSALQVAVAGGRAYVADWNDVRVFDVSNPAAPRLTATERIDTGEAFPRVLGVGAKDDVAFVGEWTGLYSYRFVPGRDAPDVAFSERELEFGTVPSGGADAIALIVENEGTAPLVAWSIEAQGSALSVDRPQLVLPPGGRQAVEITFRPDSAAQMTGRLVVRSDDPDEPTRFLPIVGNRGGLGVGDPAPEVRVELQSGGEWKLSEQAGKTVLLAYFATF
ncbi:MAG: DUF1573 domain-containing protein [Deltaproteobacteria bacterium]|nr:DUF1573 domain-containing protein [Deltaproteobacteria bacterium]